jgi:glycosyltransferase involved in cell wall biosynthesis
MLAQAMTYVGNEFPDVKLFIVGHGYMEKEDKNIRFLGYVSQEELLSLYQRCMFFALPSTTNDEGFGLVLLESMACGKPAIAFDLWGPSEAIGDCGIIVKEKTAKALAEAMIKLLGDENLRKEIGQKARERVLRYFSLETYDKLVNIYAKLA